MGGAVVSLDEAVVRMEAIDASLAPGDGVRHFNTLYLEVTREVIRQIAAGTFEDPRFLELLAVTFSNAYFAAIDEAEAPAGGSRAWAPLFAARTDRRVAPIQFALAGMNAHINFDLPIGVRETCLALELAPVDGTPQQRDYDRLNGLLGTLQERVKGPLTPGALGVIDRALGRLDDVVASFKVARARDAAWVHAKTLWSIRDRVELTRSYEETLERMVGLAGKGLLVPSLLGFSRWAEARPGLPGVLRRLLGAAPRR